MTESTVVFINYFVKIGVPIYTFVHVPLPIIFIVKENVYHD